MKCKVNSIERHKFKIQLSSLEINVWFITNGYAFMSFSGFYIYMKREPQRSRFPLILKRTWIGKSIIRLFSYLYLVVVGLYVLCLEEHQSQMMLLIGVLTSMCLSMVVDLFFQSMILLFLQSGLCWKMQWSYRYHTVT